MTGFVESLMERNNRHKFNFTAIPKEKLGIVLQECSDFEYSSPFLAGRGYEIASFLTPDLLQSFTFLKKAWLKYKVIGDEGSVQRVEHRMINLSKEISKIQEKELTKRKIVFQRQHTITQVMISY